MMELAMLRTVGAGLVAVVVAGGAVLAPSPAKAWWGPGYGPRVVVVPGYGPPPVVVPARRFWVPAHYNRFGYFVPGHWR